MKFSVTAGYLVAAVLLSTATVVLPIVSAPPPFISLNIAGTALISYSIGPLAGGFFGAFTHIALNSFGMGSGIIGSILLTRLFEGFLPGALHRLLCARQPRYAWLSPFVGALALTALVKPWSTTMAWLLSPSAGESAFLPWFCEDMGYYIQHLLPSTLAAYTFSCLVGWGGSRLPLCFPLPHSIQRPHKKKTLQKKSAQE